MRLAPFHLERYFAQHEFKVRYLLCASDCESWTIQDLLALEPDATSAFLNLRLGYVEPMGGADLRAAIAAQYEATSPEEVLVHSGAQEAIFIFANAVLAPGDHVIVQMPCYQSLIEVARAVGCAVTEWHVQEDQAWALDLDFLADSISAQTRAIILNCPHNPTGYLMPESTLREIVELARRHGILLFSDEVYRLLEYQPGLRLPAACDLYENAVSLGVTSKSLGLAGLRIGWIATRNRAVLDAMVAFKDYTTICANSPGEFLAALALRNRDILLQRNMDIIRSNLILLDGFFARFASFLQWHKPVAGPIAFPRLRDDLDANALCIDVLERNGVLLLPGSVYQFGSHHVRIGFGRRNMPQALAALEDYFTERFAP